MKLGTWGFKAHRDCLKQNKKRQSNKHKHNLIGGVKTTTVETIVASTETLKDG